MEIARTGGRNLGGGRWLELLPVAGIASYSQPDILLAPSLTIKPGFSWIRIYCTPETLDFQQTHADTDNGDTYSLSITGFSPADGLSKARALGQLKAYKKVVVRYCDNNGLIKFAGTQTQPLTYSDAFGTDKMVAGQRGYDLRVTGVTTSPAAYV